MFRVAWITRAVFEAVVARYAPRRLHVVAPPAASAELRAAVAGEGWAVGPLTVHDEEDFFGPAFGLTKDDLAHTLTLGGAHYPAGWFFQQLIKLGGHEGVPGLSDDYLVWDADLLPVDAWPVREDGVSRVALLQHKGHVPADNHRRWTAWTRDVLGVEPAADGVATFVPHHFWFFRDALDGFKACVSRHAGGGPWPAAMMRTALKHGSFSEYLAWAAWLRAHHPGRVRYHPYAAYGATAERFFDDGSGRFAAALRDAAGADVGAAARPSADAVERFVDAAYAGAVRPSSLNFEQDRRHLDKPDANEHLEEARSRWNPR